MRPIESHEQPAAGERRTSRRRVFHRSGCANRSKGFSVAMQNGGKAGEGNLAGPPRVISLVARSHFAFSPKRISI
jgi:hypothetical protein